MTNDNDDEAVSKMNRGDLALTYFTLGELWATIENKDKRASLVYDIENERIAPIYLIGLQKSLTKLLKEAGVEEAEVPTAQISAALHAIGLNQIYQLQQELIEGLRNGNPQGYPVLRKFLTKLGEKE